MLTEFGRVLLFILVGAAFVAIGMAFAWLLRPHRPYPSKNATYGLGGPLGDPHRFNIRFYVIFLSLSITDVKSCSSFLARLSASAVAFIEMLVFSRLGRVCGVEGGILLGQTAPNIRVRAVLVSGGSH
jgi:NADH:ubiquinone oxidoreductase subunit 3 (subunit A)